MSSGRAKPVIRPFRMIDLDRVRDIERESFPDPWPKFLFMRLHHWNPQGFLVAELDGEVIGYAIAEIVECVEPPKSRLRRRGHLLNLAVDLQFRRQGVGNALIKAILLYLQKEKVEDVWLEVRVSNSAARNFYSKFGFEEVDHKILYYWDEDAVVMSLKIQKGESQ